MNTLLSLKNTTDDLEVEYDILTPDDCSEPFDERRVKIAEELEFVNRQMAVNQKEIDKLNDQIDRLTNHADGLDYMVAVGSGILAGAVDSLWVGEFNFDRGKAWSNQKVNQFVMDMAKKNGYTGDRLDGAIKFLEDKFKNPSDNIWKGTGSGISAKSHHLDDLAHHPTPLGLTCSIITQFTQTGYFQNKDGTFLKISVSEDGGLIGADIPTKFFAGTVNWFFHLVSDMSGSNKTAGIGMGIPGPIVSLLKEISLLPGLNKTSLSKKVKELFVDFRFDLRSEMAVGYELARQALPVILNEMIVRAFYFIRRFAMERKEKGSWEDVEWRNTLPWKNRTVVRMLTIATGTFVAVDMADAAVRSAVKSGGFSPAFLTNFVLRVNFVGMGRFAVACVSDLKMGAAGSRLRNERMSLYNQQLRLANAKVFYKQADMWIAAENAEKTIEQAYEMMEKTAVCFMQAIQEMQNDMERISQYTPGIEEHNPGLLEDIDDILTWG